MLTQKLLKQTYVAPISWSRPNNNVNVVIMNWLSGSLPFYVIIFFPISYTNFYFLLFFLSPSFYFYSYVVVCFILFCLSLFCVLCPMLNVFLDCPYLIDNSVFSNVYLRERTSRVTWYVYSWRWNNDMQNRIV